VGVLSEAADLGVVECSHALASRELSSRELTEACLARIDERDGTHSFDGDAASINAWIRVYADDALEAASSADERLARGDAPPLCGIPLGLKDLYAVAGKPLTASSRILDDVPERDSDVWARLRAAGMVLLGHLHTHEFAAGGTTDQVGNPWQLNRTAGGSSGGSGAALAARMVPAATGTDTAGSLRIPSACCGTSTIKPTRNFVSTAGVVPLCWTLDHAGPMARTLDDCALLLDAMAGPDAGRAESAIPRASAPPLAAARLDGVRLAVSPRLDAHEIETDVSANFDAVLDLCRKKGATLVYTPEDVAPLDVFLDFTDVLGADMLGYHRLFDDSRDRYRPSIREFVEMAEARALDGWEYAAAQARRRETTAQWIHWLESERIDAILEPTLPIVAPTRGSGYEHALSDTALIAYTHYWNWTGFPVVALPSGVSGESGLPTSLSLVGPAGSDWRLLGIGLALQQELGVPRAPM
jgi:aspartyl-tRNA(Asn)/glutamyl-tRNA(Gln) amidotransferase subunit A